MAAAWGRPASLLLRDMPADEWPFWLAFNSVQNLGPLGEDLRSAVIASTVANAIGGNHKAPADFFPSLKPILRPRRPGDRGHIDGGIRSFLGRLAPAL